VRCNTTRGASQQQRIYAYLNAHIGVAREFTNGKKCVAFLGVASTQCNAYRYVGNQWIRRCKITTEFGQQLYALVDNINGLTFYFKKTYDLYLNIILCYGLYCRSASYIASPREYNLWKETLQHEKTPNRNESREESIDIILLKSLSKYMRLIRRLHTTYNLDSKYDILTTISIPTSILPLDMFNATNIYEHSKSFLIFGSCNKNISYFSIKVSKAGSVYWIILLLHKTETEWIKNDQYSGPMVLTSGTEHLSGIHMENCSLSLVSIHFSSTIL
jgi:hypothetical protein